MKVIVGNSLYEMTKNQCSKTLEVASKQVPFGIYAVKKNGIVQLANEICKDEAELKRKQLEYAKAGFKVYANS